MYRIKNGSDFNTTKFKTKFSRTIEYKYFKDGYITSGSRSSTADIKDIRKVLRESMEIEMVDKAMEVAIYEYI